MINRIGTDNTDVSSLYSPRQAAKVNTTAKNTSSNVATDSPLNEKSAPLAEDTRETSSQKSAEALRLLAGREQNTSQVPQATTSQVASSQQFALKAYKNAA